MIVLSAESGKQSSQVEQQEPVLIVPGLSVGKVVKGMTTNEVEALLGKPEKWQGQIMVYDKELGMSVAGNQSRERGLVFCGDGHAQIPGSEGIQGAHQRKASKSSPAVQDVIKAFGQPTTAKPWSPACSPRTNWNTRTLD